MHSAVVAELRLRAAAAADEDETLRPTKVDRKPKTCDDGCAAKRVRVQRARNMVIQQPSVNKK